MNSVINKDAQRLEADAVTIEKRVNRLAKDCSAWARKRAEHDLMDLTEDLKKVEADVSLIMTDCMSTGFQRGVDAPKEVFHDFQEIFGCVDTFFKDLKEARLQLSECCIFPSTLNHLKVDCKRFEKCIGKIEGHAVFL